MAPQLLAQRVLHHELGQLPAQLRVGAEGEVGLDPVLYGAEAQLAQPGDLRLGEGLEAEIGQCVAAPQRQRLAERGRRLPRLVQSPPAVGHEPLEPACVDLLRLGREHVPRGLHDEEAAGLAPGAVRLKGVAEVVDVGLEGVRRRLRWLLAPEDLEEPVRRHGAAGVDEQGGEEQLHLAARQRDHGVTIDHLERPQHPELHCVLTPGNARPRRLRPLMLARVGPGVRSHGHLLKCASSPVSVPRRKLAQKLRDREATQMDEQREIAFPGAHLAMAEPGPATVERTAETPLEMLRELDRWACVIAGAELDETLWGQLRGQVIDLIDRDNATLAYTSSNVWTRIFWDQADTPVTLTRAFATVHRRLAALVGEGRFATATS